MLFRISLIIAFGSREEYIIVSLILLDSSCFLFLSQFIIYSSRCFFLNSIVNLSLSRVHLLLYLSWYDFCLIKVNRMMFSLQKSVCWLKWIKRVDLLFYNTVWILLNNWIKWRVFLFSVQLEAWMKLCFIVLQHEMNFAKMTTFL